jgi:hypothetical protein
MGRFTLSWSRYSRVLVVVVGIIAVGRVSFAKTPPVIVAAASPSSDRAVVYRRAPSGTQELHAARFVECHISRHPIQGLRMQDRACPLLFAEDQAPATTADQPATRALLSD